jgi:hypothetical protein
MTENRIKIRLSSQEAGYLAGATYLDHHQVEAIRLGQVSEQGSVTLMLPAALAEEFRDAFTEQLAHVGFDENYDTTPEGQLLEGLIDRFMPTPDFPTHT